MKNKVNFFIKITIILFFMNIHQLCYADKQYEFSNLNIWDEYNTYFSPSIYLNNMGFKLKSECAILLMQKIKLTDKEIDILAINKKFEEDGKVFQKVFNSGVSILKNSEIYSNLSLKKIKQHVFQSLLISQSRLQAMAALIRDESEYEKMSQLEYQNLFSRNVYIARNCDSVLGIK